MLDRHGAYAIHPDTKYEARPNAREACECSDLRALPGGTGGLALVERPPPRSVEGNIVKRFFIRVSAMIFGGAQSPKLVNAIILGRQDGWPQGFKVRHTYGMKTFLEGCYAIGWHWCSLVDYVRCFRHGAWADVACRNDLDMSKNLPHDASPPNIVSATVRVQLQLILTYRTIFPISPISFVLIFGREHPLITVSPNPPIILMRQSLEKLFALPALAHAAQRR